MAKREVKMSEVVTLLEIEDALSGSPKFLKPSLAGEGVWLTDYSGRHVLVSNDDLVDDTEILEGLGRCEAWLDAMQALAGPDRDLFEVSQVEWDILSVFADRMVLAERAAYG